ncbi:hypothetical protein CHLNCDRAFT_142330 [Chlorella variabilis]|uniref:Glycerophosphocholine acyltransferase 1 n=1 Tax=Chlorella variabilis TaxID=554065 RepID=E1Z8B2_CHLVA|nr:hypothetical protein CHLNCDRAFT_142330 [Chlorella variabilis]EFN58064.1 hypothetical protein CHLNCDRAFT_142330 [Chlorella variabilis]|eukprot:XP_005850166.1 hypothetical protein CHLNCDRAFT_142330 [Chlorella variabilis]
MFGALLFLAGARPAALPAVFLLFAATALPWRVYHYTRVQPRNRVYLLDFCYAVAAATAAFLCLPARLQHPGLEAAVYALADGPVSAALVAWQCAWVFHSPDHTVSVLLHLLPGLAMAAHHHLPLHPTAAAAAAVSGARDSALWLLGSPLAFYLTWQLLYFAAVQVLGRRYVRDNNLDTSYRCLTRRARRTGNIWARLVLRGSTARRLAVYGLIQLAFTGTLGTLLLFVPTYSHRSLACAWQAVKVLVPVFYGCKYQCERVYTAAMAEGVRRHMLQLQADARAAPAVPAAKQQ